MSNLGFFNMDSNGELDLNLIELARFIVYCYIFTTFCKETLKNNSVYGDMLDDIMNLHKKVL